MRLAPHYCRHDPGVGHHAHPASLQACLRPTSSCPCPLSPSNVRLGCLSLRRHAWARRRRARRDGVAHPSARLQSHGQWACPSCLHSRASLRAPLPHPAAPVQPQPTPGSAVLRLAPGRSGEAAAALWAARKSRAHSGAAGGGCWGGRRRRGGAKRPFEFPIRYGLVEADGVMAAPFSLLCIINHIRLIHDLKLQYETRYT